MITPSFTHTLLPVNVGHHAYDHHDNSPPSTHIHVTQTHLPHIPSIRHPFGLNCAYVEKSRICCKNMEKNIQIVMIAFINLIYCEYNQKCYFLQKNSIIIRKL